MMNNTHLYVDECFWIQNIVLRLISQLAHCYPLCPEEDKTWALRQNSYFLYQKQHGSTQVCSIGYW